MAGKGACIAAALLMTWVTAVAPAYAQCCGSYENGLLATARADVDVLTSDSLKGRGYLFDGHTKAADYLRDRFVRLGLEPVEGDYFQPFPLEADVFPQTPRFSVDGRDLRLGTEFLPYPSSASGSQQGIDRIIRAGAGLVLPEQNVNEYAGKDVQDAVVVLDASIPEHLRSDASVPQAYLSKEARVEIARRFGARAVVFLVDALVFGGSRQNAAVPVFDVMKSAWTDEPERVSFDVRSVQDAYFTSQNVVGRVPGTAVPDSFIIVSAHYDHVGALGEQVYFPGANDNASGTAMLLSLAGYVAQHPLRYTAVFVAFSGEEIGLVGSRYFADHPPVDLGRVRVMLNLDMVASGDEGVMVVGGADHVDLFEMLEQVNADVGIHPLGRRRNAPNSDQYWLAQKGVPALFLYTNRGTQPYHHVNDRPETLEWEDYLQVFQLSRRFLERIAG